jgi:hypothetical protein
MTDPISDFLTRLRNAITARKAKVEIPASKMKKRLAELLRDEGFVLAVEEKTDDKQGMLTVTLRYGDRRHQPRVAARAAQVRQQRLHPQGPLGHGDLAPHHVEGHHDRPRGPQGRRGRRAHLRGLVKCRA